MKTILYRPFKFETNPKVARWLKKSIIYKFNIAEGQIRSGKDYSSTLAFIERIKISSGNVFLVGAVSSDKAMRIVGQYILDYCGKTAIKTKYNDANAIQFTYKGKINYIVFAGGYNNNSQDFVQGDTYGGIYLTEINLLNKDFISQCIKRTASLDDGFLFGTLNPKGPKHWFYTEYLFRWYEEQQKYTNKKWLNYMRLSMEDNPIMTPEKIENARLGYDPDSILYKRDILGQRVDADGIIYNIRDYNIINEFNPNDYLEYITICDQGETISASSFILAALKYDNLKHQYTMDVLKSYSYKNNGNYGAAVKMFSDTSDDYAKFIKECIDLMHKFPIMCMIDQDPEFYRNCVISFRKYLIGQQLLKYVIKDDIDQRIKAGINLLYTSKLRFYKECKEVIEDFKGAKYDMKRIETSGKFERLKEYNEYGHLDNLDAVEYAFTYYKNKLYIN